jgi:hypothetical protein
MRLPRQLGLLELDHHHRRKAFDQSEEGILHSILSAIVVLPQ